MVFQCSVLARSAFRNSFMSWALEFIFMSATHSLAPDRSLRRDCNQFTKPRLQEIFISTKEALVWSSVQCLLSARPLYTCACAALHPLCLSSPPPQPIVPLHTASLAHLHSPPLIDWPMVCKLEEYMCGLSPRSFMLSLGGSSNDSDNHTICF